MKRWNRRLHRWIGLISCVFMLIVSGTALALNHREFWLHWDLEPEQQLHFSLQQAQTWAIDPQDAQHLLAADSHYLYESRDQGQSWEEIPLYVPAEHVVGIVFSPKTPDLLWVALRDIGVFQSDDGGFVWDEIASLPFDPVAGEKIKSLAASAESLVVNSELGIHAYHLAKQDWHSQTLAYKQQKLSWQETIWKLHTGQFFGSWGLYLYDSVALCLIFLSLSGLWMAWRPRRKPKPLKPSEASSN